MGLSTPNCPLPHPSPGLGLETGVCWGRGEASVVFHCSQLQILRVMLITFKILLLYMSVLIFGVLDLGSWDLLKL